MGVVTALIPMHSEVVPAGSRYRLYELIAEADLEDVSRILSDMQTWTAHLRQAPAPDSPLFIHDRDIPTAEECELHLYELVQELDRLVGGDQVTCMVDKAGRLS